MGSGGPVGACNQQVATMYVHTILNTQRLQTLQWCVRGGLALLWHFWHVRCRPLCVICVVDVHQVTAQPPPRTVFFTSTTAASSLLVGDHLSGTWPGSVTTHVMKQKSAARVVHVSTKQCDMPGTDTSSHGSTCAVVVQSTTGDARMYREEHSGVVYRRDEANHSNHGVIDLARRHGSGRSPMVSILHPSVAQRRNEQCLESIHTYIQC